MVNILNKIIMQWLGMTNLVDVQISLVLYLCALQMLFNIDDAYYLTCILVVSDRLQWWTFMVSQLWKAWLAHISYIIMQILLTIHLKKNWSNLKFCKMCDERLFKFKNEYYLLIDSDCDKITLLSNVTVSYVNFLITLLSRIM